MNNYLKKKPRCMLFISYHAWNLTGIYTYVGVNTYGQFGQVAKRAAPAVSMFLFTTHVALTCKSITAASRKLIERRKKKKK